MSSNVIKSMTGYGATDETVGGARISAEVRSVNPRFFSPSIKTPSGLARLEVDIKELLRVRVARGHVTASVRIGIDSDAGPRIDGARIAAYAEQIAGVQRQLGRSEPIG